MMGPDLCLSLARLGSQLSLGPDVMLAPGVVLSIMCVFRHVEPGIKGINTKSKNTVPV